MNVYLCHYLGGAPGVVIYIYRERENEHYDSLMQDCCISSALAIEILQSCTKPSICWFADLSVTFKWILILTDSYLNGIY